MNADQNVTIHASRFMRENFTLHIRMSGLTWSIFRLKCAVPLIWLASKVAGVGFTVDIEQERGW